MPLAFALAGSVRRTVGAILLLSRAPALEAQQPQPDKAAADKPAQAEGTTEATTTSSGEEDADEEDTPRENLAEDLIEDSGTVSFAQPLLLPALLGMVTIMVFINIWALRTGLLTRFWGSLGVALGAAMIIILPIALLLSVIWFMALGSTLLGFGRKGRPLLYAAGQYARLAALTHGEPLPEGLDYWGI